MEDYNKIDTTIFSETDSESASEIISENHLESHLESDLENDSNTIESSFILTDGHSISGDQSLEILSTIISPDVISELIEDQNEISTNISLNTYIPIKKN